MTNSLTALLLQPAEVIAPRLLGCLLERELDGQTITVKIVETEAYNMRDPASHSYKGRTARTDVMFGPAGHLYVYFTYGLHYCCNVVTGPEGQGAAVLLRAVQPLAGAQLIKQRRLGVTDEQLTNGPAKLCQALAIDKRLNGHNLRHSPLRLCLRPPLASSDIVQTTRIGISEAKDVPWRFYIRGHSDVSRPL